MIRRLLDTLRAVDLGPVVATVAISWGLAQLRQHLQDRTAALADVEAQLVHRTAQLAQVRAEHAPMRAEPYPGTEDVDPLGVGEHAPA